MSVSRFRHCGSGHLEERRAFGELRRRRIILLVCIAMTAFLCCFAPSVIEAQEQVTEKTPQGSGPGDRSAEARELQNENEKPAANISAQQKRIAADKARLLKLATELKSEIDKAGAGTLSVAAIRKANEIETLARTVRQEMNRELKREP